MGLVKDGEATKKGSERIGDVTPTIPIPFYFSTGAGFWKRLYYHSQGNNDRVSAPWPLHLIMKVPEDLPIYRP